MGELLDKLNRSKFFLKLDLKSGYHHVRMCEKDVEKTAFKTHLEYYEFKVMPFILTNASSIFQTLINSVLEPYLRIIMLVFFDDILIYSFTMELHISLLSTILKTLKNNQLFAK